MTPQKSGAISASSVLLSSGGGSLDMLVDGEIVASIAIPAGRVLAAEYMPLLPEGAWYEADGLAVLEPRRLISSQTFGAAAYDSGANPDFRPTTTSRFEREMRVMVSTMAANNRGLEAKVRALESIERIPRAPSPAPEAQVIEPSPEADPK
jgi:hypothetical protein